MKLAKFLRFKGIFYRNPLGLRNLLTVYPIYVYALNNMILRL